jgi:hypothetical protein
MRVVVGVEEHYLDFAGDDETDADDQRAVEHLTAHARRQIHGQRRHVVARRQQRTQLRPRHRVEHHAGQQKHAEQPLHRHLEPHHQRHHRQIRRCRQHRDHRIDAEVLQPLGHTDIEHVTGAQGDRDHQEREQHAVMKTRRDMMPRQPQRERTDRQCDSQIAALRPTQISDQRPHQRVATAAAQLRNELDRRTGGAGIGRGHA